MDGGRSPRMKKTGIPIQRRSIRELPILFPEFIGKLLSHRSRPSQVEKLLIIMLYAMIE